MEWASAHSSVGHTLLWDPAMNPLPATNSGGTQRVSNKLNQNQETGRPLRLTRRLSDRILSPAILSPAMIFIVLFVYVFIAITIWVSLSNWHTLKIHMPLRQPIWAPYQQMFVMPRWHADLRNVLIFTTLFLTFSLGLGLVLALLLDRNLL